MCYGVVIKYWSGIGIHSHLKHASHNASNSLSRNNRFSGSEGKVCMGGTIYDFITWENAGAYSRRA